MTYLGRRKEKSFNFLKIFNFNSFFLFFLTLAYFWKSEKNEPKENSLKGDKIGERKNFYWFSLVPISYNNLLAQV